jgi:hypothetical protein
MTTEEKDWRGPVNAPSTGKVGARISANAHWGTVREGCSAHSTAWDQLPHDHRNGLRPVYGPSDNISK